MATEETAFNTERVLSDEQSAKMVGINNGRYFNVVTSTADTDVLVVHKLGRVPKGYLVVSQDKAGVVYTGTVPATVDNLTIKCNVATVTLKLLVW